MASTDARGPNSKNRAANEAPSERTPVVGVGASAGGVQALQTFFDGIPGQVGAAFVVIVHLDPGVRSELPEILAAKSRMPVHQVTGSSPLEKDSIYVIPPDRQLKMSDHEISAVRFTEPRGHRAPIDLFFRSLAEQHGDGFAVVLTGAGSDGAAGAKAVKEAGGIVLVQSPDEAEYPSMPTSAIETTAADVVLPLRELGPRLAELISARRQGQSVEGINGEATALRRVLAMTRARTGHDFSHYKRSTVLRRLVRRMQVARKETVDEYLAYLKTDADEPGLLLADLLISVTTFFRDSKAFAALALQVIPRLFENKQADSTIRAWVPGCATGEEAYSVGMLLLEEAARHEVRPDIQVFGSDMDTRALAVAREGRYPVGIEADMSEERLRRFFTRDGEFYRAKRELRDTLLFANHSLLKDPPFSRLDLVSCRNLLIYLDRDLQRQVVLTLHYGLNPDGYLFLGSSESAEYPDGLFRAVDRDARIYQSTGHFRNRVPMLPRLAGVALPADSQSPRTTHAGARATQSVHREALEALAPPSILVDTANRTLHLSETAGRYVLPSAGPLTQDVTELVRPELRFELRGALQRALEQGETVLTSPILVAFDGAPVPVYMQVRSLPAGEKKKGTRRAVIFFIEGRPADPLLAEVPADSAQHTRDTVQRLKQELELAQAQLRTVREESESATEELRAANEELQSINEEYRSTAEELETSKEELQSINEELQTVNSELKLKLETVSRANSDLQNLMAATDFATLFLDTDLRIKRFTPRLSDIFNVAASDVGRTITDFTHLLNYDDLAEDVQEVIRNLAPIEREVTGRKGGWYLVRMRPYRTAEDKIDGVVVTFLDVTNRRETEDALRMSELKLRQEMQLVELSRAPIFVWEFDGGIVQWNKGSEDMYGYSRREALGRSKDLLLKTVVPGSSFQAVKEALLKRGSWKGEVSHTTKDGRELTIETQLELIGAGEHRLVLESTHDITEYKAFEERQQLLIRELNHRVKNTLAIVQSMVRQTWRSSRTREDFIEGLEGRIVALSNAHKLLVDTEWHGADLHALVKSQVGSYLTANPGRLHIEGSPVRLPAEIATPLGLILHELATNASKYGALSVESGHVELSWKEVRIGNNSPGLRVLWLERHGPPVKKPRATGFGSRLIETGLPGATVRHEYLPDGVQCVIEIPF